jgi:hypothetical protein
MRRILLSLVLLSVSPIGAQTVRLGIATGAIVPYNQENNIGWHVLGTVQVGSPRSPFSVRADGMHGEAHAYVDHRLTGGTINLVGHFSAVPRARIYLLAGLGLFDVLFGGEADVSPFSETRIAYGGGAGVSIGTRPTRFFGEARYLRINAVDLTYFVLITAGASVGLPD